MPPNSPKNKSLANNQTFEQKYFTQNA